MGSAPTPLKQYVTISFEDAGGQDTQKAVSAAEPLPVTATIVGAVTVAEPVSVDDNGGSLTIDAASLPLPTGAATAALQTQPGVDIGDVTVNNGAGAAAVNVQDGGNSLTVDGTVTGNQGTPNSTANRWPVQITDGTDLALVTAAGAVQVDGSAVTQPVSIAATVQVDVTDKPARDLGKVDVASLDQYTPVSGRLPVDPSGVTSPVSVSSVDGEGSIASGQVSVTAVAGTVVAARAGRRSVLIVNHGTTDVYLGPATVSTSNGVLLTGTKGASVAIPTTALIQGIVASGSQTVSYIEVF